MSSPALPFYQQILLDLIAPPILTAIWWLMARGNATALGVEDSPSVKARQSFEFRILLPFLYVLMFGTTIYYHFKN